MGKTPQNPLQAPDYLDTIPTELITHANQCLTDLDPRIRAAYLTGTVIGVEEGKQIAHQYIYHRALQVAGDFTERFDAPHLVDWVTRDRPPLTNAELAARLKGAA